jgi:large-conductance mechanosensitive channel
MSDKDGAQIKIKYGMFLQNILDFFLIAMSIFVAIRMINILRKKQAEKTGITYHNLINLYLSDCVVNSKQIDITWKKM